MKAMHRAAMGLHTTNDLIEHYEATTGLPRPVLEEVISKSIDLLYASRDGGGNVHSSGAACAVEAVLAYCETQVAPDPRLRAADSDDGMPTPEQDERAAVAADLRASGEL